MANFTERAIREAFMDLLEENPLNKITVKDITDRCGINRNSFYYHFQDIPSLIQQIFTSEFNKIIESHPSVDSLEDALELVTEMLLENRKAILHIYNSVNRSLFEQYFWQVCRHIVSLYLKTAFPDSDISPEDKEAISFYYQCSVFGLTMGWLQRGMKDDFKPMIKRLFELRKGFAEQMLSRSNSNKGDKQ